MQPFSEKPAGIGVIRVVKFRGVRVVRKKEDGEK